MSSNRTTFMPSMVWPALLCSVCALLFAMSESRAQGDNTRQEPIVSRPDSDAIVNFSFDQVDVANFVRLVGEITGKKFVLGEGVSGKITVVSPMVNKREVYPLFVSILESAGSSVIQDGEIYRVVALPKRDSMVAPVVGSDEATPAEGIVTKIIRLQTVNASDLKKVLDSKVGGGKAGALGAIDETNHLLITDTAENIRRIEKIVAEIDKPGLSRTTEVVALEFASAEEVANQINQAMTESDGKLPLGDNNARAAAELRARLPQVPGTQSGSRRSMVVVASPHSNSLILVGTPSQIEELRKLVKQMDVDSPLGRGRLNAVFLKYLAADEAAKSLSALLAQSEIRGFAAAQKSKISIEASLANNALLVDATPGDFEIVRKLINQLDQPPQQVHISVMIWEVSSSDGLNLGLDLAALQKPENVGDTVIQGSMNLTGASTLMDAIQGNIFPQGIGVGISHGLSLDSSGNVVADQPASAVIKALRTSGKFRVLSETSLEAQNNKEATVSIVNEIPILKSTVSGGSGTARDVIQNIDRMDVGIKLKLTPHIIPGGEVQMILNPSIEAVSDPGPSDTQFTPTIAKREVSTTVTVPDGKTIVIAGLTREDKTKTVAKVPILGSIPLLGMLFRHTVESTEKTDLLILVTPRVVTDMAAAETVMKDWKKKTGMDSSDEQK